MKIREILQQALAKIPDNPTLQQFVAINPYAELSEESIYQVGQFAKSQSSTPFTLRLDEYISYFEDGIITKKDITLALERRSSSTENSVVQSADDLISQTQTLIDDRRLSQTDAVESTSPAQTYLLSENIHLIQEGLLSEKIENQLFRWLAQYIQCQEREWGLDAKEKSCLASWCEFENSSLSTDIPVDTLIEQTLLSLKIPSEHWLSYCFHIMWKLKGWVGYAKWQQKYDTEHWRQRRLDANEICLIWLLLEKQFLSEHKQCWDDALRQFKISSELKSSSVDDSLSWVWQQALEIHQHQALLENINKNASTMNQSNSEQAHTAWVFCIDTRSEGIRRHLEQQQGHETFGFAGFFGVNCQISDETSCTNQTPVILKPDLKVSIIKSNHERGCLENTNQQVSQAVMRKTPQWLAELAKVEVVGWIYGLILAIKNMVPQHLSKEKIETKRRSKIPRECENEIFQFDDKTQATKTAIQFLSSLPCHLSSAELVVIAGHGAKMTNNPYQAAYDCGACGGNAGFTNAKILCQLLNDKKVRQQCAKAGLKIRDNQLFVAALHNTTEDEIEFTASLELSRYQDKCLSRAKASAVSACQALNQERVERLPYDKNVKRRAAHWAEVVPEWGLINNYAIVVGPRRLTQSMDCQQKVFLHDYNPATDNSGELLQTILAGPVLVAHWINMQYYFASVAPKQHSAGNKVIHNVLSNVGVMEGNLSDLKTGLPIQSVFYQNERLHIPRRLLVVIYAKKKMVMDLLDAMPTLKALVDGEWLFLSVIEPESD